MRETREIEGLWWLPENPAERWVGRLTLVPNSSPRLTFTVPHGRGFTAPELPSLLHGTDQHGHPITLLYPSRSRFQPSNAISRVAYSAGYALLGIELPDKDAFRVNSVAVYMQHLFDWIGHTGFKQVHQSVRENNLCYVRPERLTFDISETLKAEIVFSAESNSAHRHFDITEDAFLRFVSSRELTFSECNALISALRSLLHFAVLKTVYPVQITIGTQSGKVEVVSSLLREEPEFDFGCEKWLFRFNDLPTGLGPFLHNWLEIEKRFDEALRCYFTTIYHPLPDTVAHLCLTQAFEAYHGIKYNSHKKQEFAQKIEDLAKLHEKSLPGVFGDTKEFAATILDNRNYYTHHNPKWLKDGRVVSGAELFRLNQRLQLLFQACVLSEIGIPDKRFERLKRQMAVRVIEFI